MVIVLRAECYRLLLEHVPETTPAYAALASATTLQAGADREEAVRIRCTEVDADLYLATAEQFFPDCLRELQSAIARATPSDV